ncbi:MAG: poly(R)-hydroxyalkanoic acid synthase subunit PhaE [Desulfobacterales bacterium]|jgi:polyhydroxyalkanoate synthesis regulator phasin
MNEKNAKSETGPDFLSAWMKTAVDVWGHMFQTWSDAAATMRPSTASPGGASGHAQASMDAAMKTWQMLSSTMARPEIRDSMFKGAGTMPEILVQLAQSSLAGFLEFQQKWFERAGRIGKTTEAYTFEDLDENAFRAWNEIYEKEFRQFFNIPQLGLTRFYQEKVNQTLDKFNLFQTAIGEFMRLLYLPVTKSFSVIQEKLGELSEAGELPEDPQKYYQMWIKILEGHYMTLFQSTEYIETMGKTLGAMSEFSAAKNDLLEDILNMLPIPKQKDMDDLYKEIYLLKKRIKALEKKLEP